MRELRVEDALMYLDQVKMEFGDRPQIYNEFLHIMKTFKSQEIDTPGVILRVTQLFQGNKALVLGFNTFLPDGFKIEIPDHGTGIVYYRTPGQPLLTPIQNMMANRPENQFDQRMPPQQQQQQPQPPHAMNSGPSRMQQLQQQGQQQGQMMGGPVGAGSQGGQQQPQGQIPGGPGPVPNQQHGPPGPGHPVNHRLKLMQNGMPQGQQGGFQQQRPQGQQSAAEMHSMQPFRHNAPQQQQEHRPMHMALPGGQQGEMQQEMRGMPPIHPQPQQQQSMQQQHPQLRNNGEQQMQGGMDNGGMQQQARQQQPAPPPPPNAADPSVPVEFDHAINYVTTIKRTFANDPDTYKKFLEILHTYQKEQRGIKEVLDEVSVLFADHPVLLKDFTYFLPDAVQQQAKMQLAHAVRQAESRRAALNSKAAIESQARQQRHAEPPQQQQQQQEQEQQQPETEHQQSEPQLWTNPTPATQPRKPFGVKEGRSEDREREICRSAAYGVVSFDPVRPPRKHELSPAQAAAKYGRPRTIPETIVQPTTKEASFFERAKEHLMRKELASDKSPGTRRHTPQSEFLKCLHLYGGGILSKDELLLLLRSLFMQGHAPKSGANASGGTNKPQIAAAANKLMKEFEKLLVGRGPYARQQSSLKDKSKYGSITCKQWDSSLCEDVTPSYKTYPSDYPYEDFFIHSGQTAADASVLNTSVVCVKNEKNTSCSKMRILDSLEEYDGVRARRNIYEEALSKVGEERFEVDFALETNASAMRQVQPLSEEVSMLKENEEKEGQPIGRLHYELRPRSLLSTHIGAIARLYGEHGDEVIHHLMKNPISVLPIVFKRLKEKDIEWRRARVELTKHWRSISEMNYEGTLDVTSYFHRREIEKSIGHDLLTEECKRAFHFVKKPKEVHKATEAIVATFSTHHTDPSMLLFHSHASVNATDKMPHKDLYECLRLQLLNSAAKTNADREKVSRIWTEFILPMFNLPTHWFLKELRDKARSDKSSCIVKYAPGQKVKTAFGDGRILAYNEVTSTRSPHYIVQLPFGKAYVRPSSIVHHNATEVFYARENGFMELVENSNDAMSDETKKEIPSSCHLVYGTEKVYTFMRLYCALLALFDSAKSNMETKIDAMEVDDDSNATKKNKFHSFVTTVKEYINEEIQFKTYESRCHSLSENKRYELSAIPRLIEKCADALVKMAREDKLLSLYDFYRLKTMDPFIQRSQSLIVAKDASFRIQYVPSDGKIHFCYLPIEKDMLKSPRNPSGLGTPDVNHPSLQNSLNVNDEAEPAAVDEQEKMNDTEDGEIGENNRNGEEPQSKRVKLV